jgi:hypothetical protein
MNKTQNLSLKRVTGHVVGRRTGGKSGKGEPRVVCDRTQKLIYDCSGRLTTVVF